MSDYRYRVSAFRPISEDAFCINVMRYDARSLKAELLVRRGDEWVWQEYQPYAILDEIGAPTFKIDGLTLTRMSFESDGTAIKEALAALERASLRFESELQAKYESRT